MQSISPLIIITFVFGPKKFFQPKKILDPKKFLDPKSIAFTGSWEIFLGWRKFILTVQTYMSKT